MPAPVVDFQHLIEEIPSVFFVYNVALRSVTYVNAAYEKVFGGNSGQVNDELPGLLARLHPDDQDYAADCLERLEAGLLREDIQVRLVSDAGLVQWLCVRAVRYQAPDGTRTITGFIDDITAEKATHQNAAKFNTKKNSILEILSHDLAGPLRLMQTLTEQLREQLQTYPDPRLHELIRIITTTCRESTDLIHDFVDNEFLESSNVELKRERVNMVERVGIMVDNYRRTQTRLEQVFTLETSAPAIYASIDENKFMQVLNNLVGNAIKFTPAGGHIRVGLSEQPGHILVTVADDGIGIPEELQEGLFDKFTKARRPGLRGEKSTGLGMSIIHTIVELHGGRIRCKSAEKQGTTFFIELPLLEAQA
ncbi:PAS domain-containing protein [Hymenobacter sp. BT186]|uniref:histidine kinase n=1 Tax=Hymenobacter telluris TaxID=2816474 RepID=A0A939EVU7_9BACT|nr:ATP-binding protein [Hymenobacter telluris]MBO0356843.1 PAS domain-containing protein [Hymenobacter telluris]MBW3372869.1 PAS domain-containing protein [Hymenobacter norwichensis]